MLKLLIAVDGSDHAKRAIDAAGKLARLAGGAEAVLVNVRETPAYYGDMPPLDFDTIEQRLRQQQSAVLMQATELARAAGMEQVREWPAVGQPATEIVQAARETGAEQIVMGTRGRSVLGGLLLGSVAQRVVHLADVPVLLVK